MESPKVVVHSCENLHDGSASILLASRPLGGIAASAGIVEESRRWWLPPLEWITRTKLAGLFVPHLAKALGLGRWVRGGLDDDAGVGSDGNDEDTTGRGGSSRGKRGQALNVQTCDSK